MVGRVNCKTSDPGKIGDCGDNFQNRLAGSCRADENIPKGVGEEARQKLPPKGRFYKDQQFCNWLGSIGILAIQGAFAKHQEMVHRLGFPTQLVRYPEELLGCSALIIPGGESTVMNKKICECGLLQPLQDFSQTHPLFGTCAGMILMARGGILNLLDVSVERNAYGPQKASFSSSVKLPFSQNPIEAIFIRAPRVTALHSSQVKVLAHMGEEPILVQQGFHLASTFHPELTDNLTLHKHFLTLIKHYDSKNCCLHSH